ncbi:lipase family protein [Pseudomonas sp. PD9R]|nr:lipase family protein [Pseudomonas sp. PD9R]
MEEWERPAFSDKMLACPLKGNEVSFQLVDEFGDGEPYAGLSYIIQDSAEQQYPGVLDDQGFAKVNDCYRGPVVLTLNRQYQGGDTWYEKLVVRESYPLPITELQVRAEQTRFFHKDGSRVEHNPARKGSEDFLQVEVRDLVKHGAHLPPIASRRYMPNHFVVRAMEELGFGPKPLELYGVSLLPNRHTLLEVRPLRALRPLLSTDSAFCALNLYQLAIMANLSYSNFGQVPEKNPVDSVRFPFQPSVGNIFGEALAGFHERWQMDASQSPVKRYNPLYEEVPYSKRFEVLPFDPTLYERNRPEKGDEQEYPSKLHFFDDANKNWLSGKSTQAFITHHDEIILISIRGTLELADWWRDADAQQVPFDEGHGKGKVHHGFYDAYKALKVFVQSYLDQFHTSQKIIICGHSLGGAIATLLAEALRCDEDESYDILLYTYGSPRVGDATFVAEAEPLIHHRMVNNDDMVPGVPAPWMDVKRSIWMPGIASLVLTHPVASFLIFAIGLVRIGGAPYQHHGKLQHFMPVAFNKGEQSSILWEPGCASIEEAACTRALANNGDLPFRGGFFTQARSFGDHSVSDSYVPFSWATLRRWQQTQEAGGTIVTTREYEAIANALADMQGGLSKHQRKKMDTRQYANNDPSYTQVVDDLSAEQRRLNTSLERLSTLRFRPLKLTDVYGSAAQSSELQATLQRWMAHRENNLEVQIAMIPPRVFSDEEMLAAIREGREPGTFARIDIDSLS